MSKSNRQYLTKNELAQLIDVSLTTIDKWLQKGLPYKEKGDKGKGYKFYFPEVMEWIIQNKLKRLNVDSSSLEEIRKRKELADARLKELELDKRRGKLIEKTEVEKLLIEIGNAFKKKLLSWMSKLPPRLEKKNKREILKILDEEINELLEDFHKHGVLNERVKNRND